MKPVDKAPGGGSPKRSGGNGTSKCVMCGKPVVHDYRPFCSKRCADVDLGRWLSEGYSVPAEPDDGDEWSEPDA